MDIVTGKDHPKSIKIHGIDLCNPDEDYSVSQWYSATTQIICQTKALPIVVGGTGMYVKSLLYPPDTLHIPINYPLRKRLATLSVNDLKFQLQQLSPLRLQNMNSSDQNNPRRLIRAIEVAQHLSSHKTKTTSQSKLALKALIIGINPPLDRYIYYQKIKQRVISRIENGAIAETASLIKKYSVNQKAFSALGYPLLIRYLTKKINKDELIEAWTQEELRYAKSQLLFFRTIPNITWFTHGEPMLLSKVEKIVKTWYDKDN